jgi:Swt1-like HEPN
MSTNSALRSALLAKLGLTQQGLSKRVQLKKAMSPMSTEDAAYLIAHEAGIKIDKYLTDEQVDRVRGLHSQLKTAAPPVAARRSTRPRSTGKSIRQVRFPDRFIATSAMLSTGKLTEAQEMAKVYPILYVLENSMREVIKRAMSDAAGADWWSTELTTSKLRDVHTLSAKRMKNERSWHQRRGSHPIDYVDLDDLGQIIVGKAPIFFPAVIQEEVDWFRNFMKELAPSRNVVCHMNPLEQINVEAVKISHHRWEGAIRKWVEALP